MPHIVLNDFNITNAKEFISDIASENYYLGFCKHTPYGGSDSTVPDPVDTLLDSTFSIYDDMIFGKKVRSFDVNLVVSKFEWTSGTVYDIYDDVTDLTDKRFYVATPNGTDYNVYKCLFNNNGGQSLVMPTGIDTNAFIESDGYMWKYLYSITASQWKKFNTTSYMPVYTSDLVKDSANDRSIEVVLSEYSGAYYNNHYNGAFENGTQIVSPTQFRLSGDASVFNDFYTGCIIEFQTGIGNEYKEIIDYTVSGAIKTITIDSPVETFVEVGDTYQIYPQVKIKSDGNETSKCLAWAIVDPMSSNTISRVEILRGGEGYRRASAEVVFDESVGVTDTASLRPIISPVNGHGYDPEYELKAKQVCISVTVNSDENGNVIADNDFRTVALLKNPEFNRLELKYTGTSSIFNIGEGVVQYRPIRLIGSVDYSNNQVSGVGTYFTESIKTNDTILLQNATSSFITSVNAVLDDSTLTVTSNTADMTGSEIYLVDVESNGKVATYTSNSITITEVISPFTANSKVIGTTSYATITPTEVLNNGKNTNDFVTFQQTVRFDGAKTSVSNFIQDEVVYQQGSYTDESLRPTGRLFYYKDDVIDSLYITNEQNSFSPNATIVGNTSGSIFVATNKYQGDLIKDQGKVLYITNVEAVLKSNTSSETVKIVLNF